jgi:UDP-3-O-[3-hydroxymyristoyl] N-acetylglucosamine deacetylase
VKPAFANEGRYFVRVPEGTNGNSYSPPKPTFVSKEQLDINYGAEDGLDPEDRAQLFLQYMSAKGEDGEDGEEFGDYLQRHVGEVLQDGLIFESLEKGVEEPVGRRAEEESILASIEAAEVYGETTLLLRSQGDGNFYVMSPEALLSALEACGVDNARIEIEGGSEVPVADGSALTWALEVQKAGLRDAVPRDGEASNVNVNNSSAISEMFSVTGGRSRPGAFVSFYPSTEAGEDGDASTLATILTAGVDCASSEAIGRQWMTWKTSDASPEDEFAKHYRWAVAPARQVFTSYGAVEELFADGLIQAGPDGCCLIAEGDSWYDPNLVRFPLDEAARHAVQRLMGVLSLCAAPGHRGMPKGHIVAFDATPEMLIEFATRVKQQIM